MTGFTDSITGIMTKAEADAWRPTRVDKPCDLNDGNPNNTFDISSSNGDANCFRERSEYSTRLVSKNPKVCNNCVYNPNQNDTTRN
jgi:hypothetical protein